MEWTNMLAIVLGTIVIAYMTIAAGVGLTWPAWVF